MSSRIKYAFPYGEKAPDNMFSDFEWLHVHRNELSEKYGSAVVVIYKEEVLGVGESYEEALKNAEDNLPDSPEIITPIVTTIGNRSFRLRRVHTKSTQD